MGMADRSPPLLGAMNMDHPTLNVGWKRNEERETANLANLANGTGGICGFLKFAGFTGFAAVGE
jgi:hypothetical protein